MSEPEIYEWQPSLEHIKDMRDFYKGEIRRLEHQIWQGTRGARAICNFIKAFGYCGNTIGGKDRPDTLACQLRLGHEGRHEAFSVRWT